jgi:hypothetical protein
MKRESTVEYMARKAAAEAHYAKVLGGTIAEVAARNAAKTAHMSPAEKQSWLNEKYEAAADGCFAEDRAERIAERESRLIGNY